MTRLVRIQLAIFAVITVVSLTFTSIRYADVPRLVGFGGYEIAADFKDVSGLYPGAIVTYRGVDVGEVDKIELVGDGAKVHLRITKGVDIPADALAELHSTSAIGEQYVDLVPTSRSAPPLAADAVIARAATREMPQIGPVLESLDGLLGSVPTEATSDLLGHVETGLGGAADDLGGVIDDTTLLVAEASRNLKETEGLVGALDPLLDTQNDLAQSTLGYADALASLTGELSDKDPQLRSLLKTSGRSIGTIQKLVDDVSPTLPLLLADLTTSSQVVNTYLPNVEQTLVIYPALVSRLQSTLLGREASGDVRLDLKVTVNDPPSCIKGYIPPSERRSPAATEDREFNGAAHCEMPAGAKEGVRGLRNLPCVNDPGRRSATPIGCGLAFPGRDGEGLQAAAAEVSRTHGGRGAKAGSGSPAVNDLVPQGESDGWKRLWTDQVAASGGGSR